MLSSSPTIWAPDSRIGGVPSASSTSGQIVSKKKSNVPESAPGEKVCSGCAGKSGLTSAHVEPAGSENAVAISSNVSSVANVFPWLTTSERASVPTRISIGVDPQVASQSATSSSLMGREALEMSEAPSTQNRSKPPPDPIESIEYSGPPSSCHLARTAVDRGNTVEDPAIPTSPEATSSGSTIGRPRSDSSISSLPEVGGSVASVSPASVVVVSSESDPPHAATTRVSTVRSARTRLNFSFIRLLAPYWNASVSSLRAFGVLLSETR